MKANHSPRWETCAALAITLVLVLGAGCQTRSISDSDYGGRYGGNRNPFYRGELSEFDLLGLERGGAMTDEQIAQTLESAARPKVTKGSRLLLIQSGAYQPDEPMRAELSKQFIVVPFTGQPGPTNGLSYAKALRLAAAQAGCATIVCYWGSLESARTDMNTKSVSWVPVVGGMFPDEKQQMRIRLKVALVDVRTGHWTMFASRHFDSNAISRRFTRESSDQGQVEQLKRLAYESVAADIANIYTN